MYRHTVADRNKATMWRTVIKAKIKAKQTRYYSLPFENLHEHKTVQDLFLQLTNIY